MISSARASTDIREVCVKHLVSCQCLRSKTLIDFNLSRWCFILTLIPKGIKQNILSLNFIQLLMRARQIHAKMVVSVRRSEMASSARASTDIREVGVKHLVSYQCLRSKFPTIITKTPIDFNS